MDAFNEGDAALQMSAVCGMALAVLAVRPKARAVGEHRLEAIEVVPGDVGVAIDDQAGELLADALPHDASLTVLNFEALFEQYRGDALGEAIGLARESIVAGEGKIVGVAGVCGAGRLRQALQAAIGAIGAKVSQRGRCGRSLRQVVGTRLTQMPAR
jgi:hypothetical protein